MILSKFLMLGGSAVAVTPPVDPVPLDPARSSDGIHEILVRDRRSLDLIGYIIEFEDAHWIRRDVEAGSFGITVRHDAIDPALIQPGNLIEIRRNGEHEFAGIIRWRDLSTDDQWWQVNGPDLLGYFLTGRKAGLFATETYSGPADLVLKQFVNNNGGNGTDVDRQWQSEVSVPWIVAPDTIDSVEVTFSALRRDLLAQVVTPLARAGDLVVHVHVDPTDGYRFETHHPVAVEEDSIPFSMSWDNVSDMRYHENLDAIRNAVYVLGAGTGEERQVVLVEDADSIALHGRREAIVDARDAVTLGDLELLGRTEIAASLLEAVTVDAKQALSPAVEYRVDYDVGRDIALSIPEAGVERLVRRVVGLEVTLTRAQSETVGLFLGASPQTMPVLVREALIKSLLSQRG